MNFQVIMVLQKCVYEPHKKSLLITISNITRKVVRELCELCSQWQHDEFTMQGSSFRLV